MANGRVCVCPESFKMSPGQLFITRTSVGSRGLQLCTLLLGTGDWGQRHRPGHTWTGL